eukprot:CAMPEP_0170628294 /NCGR_PEP_ID=MMETSP0224-20130122/32588_1 /TAXON_ID=285029 /ORGANISM="Togula jolla, Strain CCCM 725" /LENGTH=172 /DNA_ID=CAMNT_0010955671 /DNA_START=45 /DNA_END=563 /DNA_ORIENTATION=-
MAVPRRCRSTRRTAGSASFLALAALVGLSLASSGLSFVTGGAPAVWNRQHAASPVTRNIFGTEEAPKVKEEEINPMDTWMGVGFGVVTVLGGIFLGAVAISGAVLPMPVGFGILVLALLGVIYWSLNGTKDGDGKEVDWTNPDDIKEGQDVIFMWPWLKEGEYRKAGPWGFF